MQITIKKLFVIACVALVLTSCGPRIAGTWNVQRYETVTAGQQGISLSNIGTMQFKRNGKGEKKMNYSVLGVTRKDNTKFKWIMTDTKTITIDGKDSEFAKTWIIVENKKNFQQWKSTDGSNNVQTLELKR